MDTNAQITTTFEFLRLLAKSSLSRTQRDVLRAMLTFADHKTWELWPSMGTLARAMGCDRRTVQRTVSVLHELGFLTTHGATRSGACRMRIEVEYLRENAEGELPPSPVVRPHGAPPPAIATPPDASESHGGATPMRVPPGPNVAQTRQESEQERTMTTARGPSASPAAAAVALILGSDALLTHPNATPERLDYIARVAPTKTRPAGFAASAIREGYEVVPPTRRELDQDRETARVEALRRFRAMPEHDRDNVWAEARSRYGDMLEQHNSARYRDIAVARTMKELGL